MQNGAFGDHIVSAFHLGGYILMQILSRGASFYISDRPVTDINVIASICVLNFRFCR